MGLSSVLSTAVTGLTASETTIDVVGNNIANSNTVGFKASEVVFATQFLQTLSLGSAPTDTNGGTNPRQTGLGVQVAAISPNFSQGTIQISSNETDFAIQGEGFFIVEGSQGERRYSRNGIFELNGENELVTSTGERLLGFGVDEAFQIQETDLTSISIPLGNVLVAQATTEVTLTGNLSPTGDLGTTSEIVESSILGDASFTAPTVQPDANIANVPANTALGASQASGGGMTPGQVYQYRVVFFDTNGIAGGTESVASSPLSVTVGAGHDAIQLTSLPTAPAATYAQRRIYRTDAGGSTFKLLASIPDNTTTSFTDTTATGAVGATLNTDTLLGQYTYYVTFTDTLGGGLVTPNGIESRPIVADSQPNVNGGRVQLTSLPTDSSGQWVGRRIYRNRVGFPNDFRLIAEIPNNTASQTYTDYAADSTITGNKTLDLDGPRISSSTLLTNVLRRQTDGTYQQMFTTGDLTYGARKGVGTSKPLIATKDYDVASLTTVQDLMTFMDQSLGLVTSSDVPSDTPTGLSPGISVDNGRIRVVGNTGIYNAVQVQNDSLRQTTGNIDLGFNSTQGAVGAGSLTTFQVIDSLGEKLDVRLSMVLESRDSSETVYRWYADASENSLTGTSEINVGTGLVRFDGSGRLNTDLTDNLQISVFREGFPATSPLNVSLDFGQVTGLATATNTLSAPRTDGFPPGQLTSFIVGEDGRIRGVFDNGAERDLGQIRLARFANPGGLVQQGQNSFSPGVNSGLPIEGNPGEQGIGSLIAGAVELSNTDIGKNLIDLILASTQYRGNTRVITAAQQLLDELLNLRR